jgi:hypothetical protein
MNGVCTICGRIGPIELHHVAGFVHNQWFITPLCISCHDVVDVWQRACGINLKHDHTPGVMESVFAAITGAWITTHLANSVARHDAPVILCVLLGFVSRAYAQLDETSPVPALSDDDLPYPDIPGDVDRDPTQQERQLRALILDLNRALSNPDLGLPTAVDDFTASDMMRRIDGVVTRVAGSGAELTDCASSVAELNADYRALLGGAKQLR